MGIEGDQGEHLVEFSGANRIQALRGLALGPYLALEPQKRQGPFTFSVPPEFGKISMKDIGQGAAAIHDFRFPDKHLRVLPEAQQAARNYFGVVIGENDGSSKVHLFFSSEDYEKYLKELDQQNLCVLLKGKIKLPEN